MTAWRQADAVYRYTTGNGRDTITHSGGDGNVALDGITLSGGAQFGDALVHRSGGGKHLYVRVDAKNPVLRFDSDVVVYDQAQASC